MQSRMPLYLSADYPCSYRPGQRARNLVVDPLAVNQSSYQRLVQLGFRRSGNYVYSPHCTQCNACRSLRVATAAFRPDRSQRRNRQRNRDLALTRRPLSVCDEHYELFRRYVEARHPQGGMDALAVEEFFTFLASDWCESALWEWRDQAGELLCGAVVDRLADGYSAVYTYFSPEVSARGLGTYAILCQLQEARRERLDWVYLGYHIRDCDKMNYKSRFQPHQIFRDGTWHWEEGIVSCR